MMSEMEQTGDQERNTDWILLQCWEPVNSSEKRVFTQCRVQADESFFPLFLFILWFAVDFNSQLAIHLPLPREVT